MTDLASAGWHMTANAVKAGSWTSSQLDQLASHFPLAAGLRLHLSDTADLTAVAAQLARLCQQQLRALTLPVAEVALLAALPPELEELTVEYSSHEQPATAAGLAAALPRLSSLNTFDITHWDVSAALEALPPRLSRVRLHSCTGIGSAGLASLAHLPLRQPCISDCQHGEPFSIGPVASLSSLMDLELRFTNAPINAASMAALEALAPRCSASASIWQQATRLPARALLRASPV